jgi:hypothetical protein
MTERAMSKMMASSATQTTTLLARALLRELVAFARLLPVFPVRLLLTVSA